MKSFPKNIHLLWWQGRDSLPDRLAENVDRWRALNPDWRVVWWDADSVRGLLETAYPDLLKRRWFGLRQSKWSAIPDVRASHLPSIKQIDACRFLILAAMGGAYFDLDIIPVRPLDHFLADDQIYLKTFKAFQEIYPSDVHDSRKTITLTDYDTIMFREIHERGADTPGVANGCMIAKKSEDPESSFMMDVFKFCYARRNEQVLKAFGPHAIAEAMVRFKRNGIADRHKVVLLPCYYTLWDEKVFGKRYWFVLSEHDGSTGGQSWKNTNGGGKPWTI